MNEFLKYASAVEDEIHNFNIVKCGVGHHNLFTSCESVHQLKSSHTCVKNDFERLCVITGFYSKLRKDR